MVGAATGVKGWRRAGGAASLLVLIAGCGSGGNDLFVLPAGSEFDATAGPDVLVVVESQNACGGTGGCEATAPAPCHLGAGNTRGLALYRLGINGTLFDDPNDDAVGAVAEQVIPTDDNPRRVVVHPSDARLLYVATNERIQVFRLAPDGGTRCIDETLSERDVSADADDLDPIDMVIDPTFGHGILYVAAKGANRVDAYTIADDGTLPELPSSCVVGSSAAEFSALAPLSNTFIAAGGHDSIAVYERVDGQFPDVQHGTPTPSATPPGTPAPTPSPAVVSPEPSPVPTCIGAIVITEPISEIGAGIVTDLEFLSLSAAPLGDLVVGEEDTLRLFSFPIDTAGQLTDTGSLSTSDSGFYQRILRVDRSNGSFLYASVFQEGRVEAFRLEPNGQIPDGNFSRTRSDPFTLPVGLAVDGPAGPIVYVAQEGVGRVDGFRIRDDGGLDSVPATSTAAVQNDLGQTLQTFPDDVAIVPLP